MKTLGAKYNVALKANGGKLQVSLFDFFIILLHFYLSFLKKKSMRPSHSSHLQMFQGLDVRD